MSFFKAEDFEGLGISPHNSVIADRANAKRDAEIENLKVSLSKSQSEIERLRAEKKRIQDSNREYSASLVQEIVSLKDDNTRLREALSIVEGCNSPSCNCAEIARAALGEKK